MNKIEKAHTITVFDLANYLLRYSSDERLLSVNEIIVGITAAADYCEEYGIEYSQLTDIDYRIIEECLKDQIKYDRSQYSTTIKRQVLRLLNEYTNVPLISGICIRCADKALNSAHKVYYLQSIFTHAQIVLLQSLIRSAPLSGTADGHTLISKINDLTDIYNRSTDDPCNSEDIYCRNLNKILRALSPYKTTPYGSRLTSAQAAMTHRSYEKTYRKQTSRISFCYPGCTQPQEVLPSEIIWKNGDCYLKTVDCNSRSFSGEYRIDLMTNVKCLEESSA